MRTHHKIMKIVIVTGVMALLTAISQWNLYWNNKKLQKAIEHIQELDQIRDSAILVLQYQSRIDSVVRVQDTLVPIDNYSKIQ
jgi:hypothetical protein